MTKKHMSVDDLLRCCTCHFWDAQRSLHRRTAHLANCNKLNIQTNAHHGRECLEWVHWITRDTREELLDSLCDA